MDKDSSVVDLFIPYGHSFFILFYVMCSSDMLCIFF